MRQRDLPRHGPLVPPIMPTSAMGWWGPQKGRAVTTAMRLLVRPATPWMRVVSSASARLIAGRMVTRRRASIDVPAPGVPASGWERRNFTFHLIA